VRHNAGAGSPIVWQIKSRWDACTRQGGGRSGKSPALSTCEIGELADETQRPQPRFNALYRQPAASFPHTVSIKGPIGATTPGDARRNYERYSARALEAFLKGDTAPKDIDHGQASSPRRKDRERE
jgi:hypothetical protein